MKILSKRSPPSVGGKDVIGGRVGRATGAFISCDIVGGMFVIIAAVGASIG